MVSQPAFAHRADHRGDEETVEFSADDDQVETRLLKDRQNRPLGACLGEGEAIETGLRERLTQTRADHPVVQGQQSPYGVVIDLVHKAETLNCDRVKASGHENPTGSFFPVICRPFMGRRDGGAAPISLDSAALMKDIYWM